jgi:hypothetical protein
VTADGSRGCSIPALGEGELIEARADDPRSQPTSPTRRRLPRSDARRGAQGPACGLTRRSDLLAALFLEKVSPALEHVGRSSGALATPSTALAKDSSPSSPSYRLILLGVSHGWIIRCAVLLMDHCQKAERARSRKPQPQHLSSSVESRARQAARGGASPCRTLGPATIP